jgi:hypothetical protein
MSSQIPTPQSQKSYFDLLSDDLLQRILVFVMERTLPVLFDDISCGLYTGETKTKNIAHDVRRLSQNDHVDDWVLINSISQRIRKLGSEAFFRGKTFGMDINFPEKILRGSVPFLQENVRKIALENITDVCFMEMRTHMAVDFMRLPQQAQLFPALKSCTCLAQVDKFDHISSPIDLSGLDDTLAGQLAEKLNPNVREIDQGP